jgi:hypothetical protein
LVETRGRYYDLAFGKRPAEELYRVADDPACLLNLATDPKHQDALRALRSRLETMLRAEEDPRTLGQGAIFDAYKYLGDRKNKGYDEWLATQPNKQ